MLGLARLLPRLSNIGRVQIARRVTSATNLRPRNEPRQNDCFIYQRLIEGYCIKGDVEKASDLLQKMIDADMEINEAIFASLIIGYMKLDEPPKIEEMFELMESKKIIPGARAYAAAIKSSAYQLKKNREQAIKDLGYIYKRLSNDDVEFRVISTIELIQALQPHTDLEVVNNILRIVEERGKTPQDIKETIYRLFDQGQVDKATTLFWALVSTDKHSAGLIPFMRLLTNSNAPDDLIVKEATKFRQFNYKRNCLEEILFHASKSARIKLMRYAIGELKKEKGQLRCVYYWPLIARSKNSAEVLNVMKNDFDYSGSTDDELAETLLNWVLPALDNLSMRKLLDQVANDEIPMKKNVLVSCLIDRLSYIAEKYTKTPGKNQLMLYCLKTQDSENLQRLMNLSAKMHGEMNSLFDLATACLECDKARQAKKILTSPGFRVSPKRIYHYCNRLADEGSQEKLELYVDLVKHIVGVQMEQLTQILIEFYEKRRTPERILEHWSKIQEDEIHANRKVMLKIADLLERHNMEVPFQKPVPQSSGQSPD